MNDASYHSRPKRVIWLFASQPAVETPSKDKLSGSKFFGFRPECSTLEPFILQSNHGRV